MTKGILSRPAAQQVSGYNLQRPADFEHIAATATHCLHMELETWPKPGLVSHIDCGSHDDMDADTFRASAAAIAPFFQEMAEAGGSGCEMGHLRVIGIQAEAAMRAVTRGVNTHRGAIFGMGLLCAAAGARATGLVSRNLSLGAFVARQWAKDIVSGPVLLHSHGDRARRRFGAGGARIEAAHGFPTVYQVGLPALRNALNSCSDDPEAARVETCFSLIAALEDTNLLHRGGPHGLLYARQLAKGFLDAGGISDIEWRSRAESIHRLFCERWLSPGGSADLLALTLFANAFEGQEI